MDYNFHTHTTRSNHAVGEDEEYIARAIENGVKYMGFSDHIPLVFPDGEESFFRVPIETAKKYCDDIKLLGQNYKGKIDIIVGFESEYYPEYFSQMLQNAISAGGEYLILGQHYSFPENTGAKPSTAPSDIEEELKSYVDVVISAMKTGVFTYVAHPDIFCFLGSDEIYEREMTRLCSASRELRVPLEINFLGIRDSRNYPKGEFWKIAGREKSPVTFGFDAHDPYNAYDGKSLIIAENMVKEYGLNYIGRPKIVSIKDILKG